MSSGGNNRCAKEAYRFRTHLPVCDLHLGRNLVASSIPSNSFTSTANLEVYELARILVCALLLSVDMLTDATKFVLLRTSIHGCQVLLSFLLIGASILTGCGSDDPQEAGCLVSTDCPPGETCSAGTCMAGPGGGPSPIDMSPGFDAGPRPEGPRETSDGGISSCPEAVSCDDIGANCGIIEDGCDGFLDCGACAPPETCGGGGTPNQCGSGNPTCTPATCQSLGAQCGFADDGCNGMLDCGACQGGLTCGGGGTPNQCGGSTCTPATCESLGARCGDLGDGCSGQLSCGDCPTNHYCDANRCICTPKSCDDLNAECGKPDDGCGTALDCGDCDGPEYCGGGDGTEYQCGCTNTPQPPIPYTLFRNARNVELNSNGVSWRQLGDAQQINTQGANFSVRGICGREAGGDNGCGCCARAQSVTASSDGLTMTNAGLRVPADAIIRGIEVHIDIKRNGGGTTVDEEVALVGGPQTSVNRATGSALSLSTGYRRFTYGGRTDLWGRSWTPAILNSANFGVRLRLRVTAGCSRNASSCTPVTPYVDGSRVRVYYDTCE